MEDFYARLAALSQRGEPVALATVIRAERSVPRHAGSKMIIRADGGTIGTIGGGGLEKETVQVAVAAIADGECRRLVFDLTGKDGCCGGEIEVFIEPLQSQATFVIIGMGHVGKAVLDLGRHLSFRFLACDDRHDFLSDCTAATILAAAPADLADRLELTSRTVVLLCTRSHELDGEALAAVFAAERRLAIRCAYIGLIGSRTKAAHIRRRFEASTDLSARFDEVSVPVGLDLGAETPHEIALSVLAEVLAVTRDRTPADGVLPLSSKRRRNR